LGPVKGKRQDSPKVGGSCLGVEQVPPPRGEDGTSGFIPSFTYSVKDWAILRNSHGLKLPGRSLSSDGWSGSCLLLRSGQGYCPRGG
jgi:hypothetical protein